MIKLTENGTRCELYSPTDMPRCGGFLWNSEMMIQITCRGYAIAQFMQPEPSKYSYQPIVEGKIFMLPEQPFFAHSPGRFFYIKDEETNEIFSAPYEPVRVEQERYCFSVGKYDIRWEVEHLGIELKIILGIPSHGVAELWDIQLINRSSKVRKISFYPYFSFGYMSWMNQSACYSEIHGGIIGSSVTPYQKLDDYFKNSHLKDKTCFLHSRAPDAWEACRDIFEGEGGIHNPTGVQQSLLGNGEALYETPVGAFQYRLTLSPDQQESFRFVLAPAQNEQEVAGIRDRYLSEGGYASAKNAYKAYIDRARGVLQISIPDDHFNQFVNHWLPRQMFYHGDVNRLSTDPQTRNYLQDSMGMSYIDPEVTKRAYSWALAQQESSGAMPDGILLREGAELKYINQIPHSDHCVWLPVCLSAYLNETGDYAFLDTLIKDWRSDYCATVYERINQAMRWLLKDRDERGLNFIAQGDWNDPMNMVGYKGKGVSGWLSVATAYALNEWASVCGDVGDHALAEQWRESAAKINEAVNRYLWDGEWYARGITDDDVVFGIASDHEGRIFLNPQSWALMAGTPDARQTAMLLKSVDEQLLTPYGVMMLAPAYTSMREDVGRVTQKHPGSAENGSIYNHAAAFYAWGLCCIGEADRAYDIIRRMLPGPDPDDLKQRGHLPVSIPNYYRGAYFQFPRTAGRSSQLFNTGTVAWVYRALVEGIFGLKGVREGLCIQPQLPAAWPDASVKRHFRGADFSMVYLRDARVQTIQVTVDGRVLTGTIIREIEAGRHYQVEVRLPA